MSQIGDPQVGPERGRGRPRRIGRAEIVAAARACAPAEVTMQAVADRLGVDRKAIHYHVRDRDRLLELVAADVFLEEIRARDLPPGLDWPATVRAYTAAIRGAVVATGSLAANLLVTNVGPSAYGLAEQLLQALAGAGLGPADAGRALTLLSAIAYTAAQEELAILDPPLHAATATVGRHLAHAAPDAYPALRQLVAARSSQHFDEEQFAFDVDVVIGGLRARLDR
jgi:AcrR family transcriptional regulator